MDLGLGFEAINIQLEQGTKEILFSTNVNKSG